MKAIIMDAYHYNLVGSLVLLFPLIDGKYIIRYCYIPSIEVLFILLFFFNLFVASSDGFDNIFLLSAALSILLLKWEKTGLVNTP